MQVTVTDNNLNIRVGQPSLNALNTNYLEPGSVIEVDGQLYKGDSYNGIDTWLKDAANNYYWSGGVKAFQQWMVDLNIPQIWNYATGKGVGVAILDTGIMNNIPDLPLDDNYFVYDGSQNLIDTDGHGTYCAALVGLRKLQGDIIGIAPGVQIFNAKISDSGQFDDNEADSIRYAKAIDWCASQNDIHVISISWANPLVSTTIKNNIQSAIDGAIAKNKIVVCAIGDASSFNDNTEYIPACMGNTIGVGSIPVNNKFYPFINRYLSVVLNGDNIDSYKITGFPYTNYGTSWSNAIMAGVIALLIEKLNFSYDLSRIQSAISQVTTGVPYTIGSSTNALPTLDPNKLLTFFKN